MLQEIIHYACFAVYLVWLRGQIKLTEILMHIKGKRVGKLTCNVNHLVRTPSILWVKREHIPTTKKLLMQGTSKDPRPEGELTRLREQTGNQQD